MVVKRWTGLDYLLGCSSTIVHHRQREMLPYLDPWWPYCREHRNYRKKCFDSALLSWWSKQSGNTSVTEENTVGAPQEISQSRQCNLCSANLAQNYLANCFLDNKENFAGYKYLHPVCSPLPTQALRPSWLVSQLLSVFGRQKEPPPKKTQTP